MADDEQAMKYGFKREEMFSCDLSESVDEYYRHVFLCYKTPAAWEPYIQNAIIDPLPKLFWSAMRARSDDITVETEVTVYAGGDASEDDDGDVMIFPEMIKYKGLEGCNVESFVEDVLVNGKAWTCGVQEVLTGSYIFVCCHGKRDKRCGVCGPLLIEKFKEEIESRKLKNQLFVYPCSHLGLHMYAGNLIIFSPISEEKCCGHWYGYVTPDAVPELLNKHIAEGVIIPHIWRGQMRSSTIIDGKRVYDHRPASGSQVGLSCCCQGANVVSCCRTRIPEVNKPKETRQVVRKLLMVLGAAAVAYFFRKRSI